jgi:hypothetical protein
VFEQEKASRIQNEAAWDYDGNVRKLNGEVQTSYQV